MLQNEKDAIVTVVCDLANEVTAALDLCVDDLDDATVQIAAVKAGLMQRLLLDMIHGETGL